MIAGLREGRLGYLAVNYFASAGSAWIPPAAGIGITVLPRPGLGTSLAPGLVALPVVEPTPKRSIAVRVREAVRDNPAARRFVELLRREVRADAHTCTALDGVPLSRCPLFYEKEHRKRVRGAGTPVVGAPPRQEQGAGMKIGFKLMAEQYGPRELVRQAVRAEEAGFDFVEISDHYHPWLHDQGHSPFAWSVLAAIAERTERIDLGTGVTRRLWSVGYHSYDGEYLTLEDARVFDLPETPPRLIVALSGKASASVAAEMGDGMFANEPKAELPDLYARAGGSGPRYSEVPLAVGSDIDAALQKARDMLRFTMGGWKVMAELPNPVNFEAATARVTVDDIRPVVSAGPDPEQHLAQVRRFADAGFDHLALLNAGADVDRFLDYFSHELAEPLGARGARPPV